MGRIPIADILMVRGINVLHKMHPFCNKEAESVNHIFLQCEFAHTVHSWIFKWLGLGGSRHSSIKEFLNSGNR